MKVGIFDSGLGGLTILKRLIEKYPKNEYIYYGDTYNIPYGEKTKEQLLTLANNIIEFLLENNVDIIIMACGTLSSNIYDDIKDKYSKKIYDIITPTVEYLESNNIKNVLLIATPMTIKSGVFANKISSKNINVYSKACPKFVPIIEKRSNENINTYIDEYLSEYKDKDIDVIIPGCTHYPLIEKEITSYLNKPFIDIGSIIANYLKLDDSIYSLNLYFSKVDNALKENVNNIFPNITIVEKKI